MLLILFIPMIQQPAVFQHFRNSLYDINSIPLLKPNRSHFFLAFTLNPHKMAVYLFDGCFVNFQQNGKL